MSIFGNGMELRPIVRSTAVLLNTGCLYEQQEQHLQLLEREGPLKQMLKSTGPMFGLLHVNLTNQCLYFCQLCLIAMVPDT